MKRLTLLAALFAAAFCAYATDGVLEINQVKLDAAGGTYVISQPGSYRLTSNLTQTNASADVIQVTASNVTIDLNGFSIAGSTTCTFVTASSSVVCNPPGPGVGINFVVQGLAVNGVVRNGSVKRIGSACIKGAHLVEDVLAESCGQGAGVSADVVRRVQVSFSGVGRAIVADHAIDSVASGNGGVGIEGSTEVVGCRSENNVGDGIYVSGAGTVRNSSSAGNLGHGIRVGGGLVSGNIIESNKGAGIMSGISQLTSVIGNVIDHNGSDLVNSHCGIQFYGPPGVALTSQNILYENGPPNASPGFDFAICNSVSQHLPSMPPNTNLCNGAAC